MMRITLVVAAAALSANVSAGTFELDNTQYWQVQLSSTFENVCEGFIASCEVEDGVEYTVINHTTGERLENQIAPQSTGLPVRVDCEERIVPAELLADDPALSGAVPALACQLSCPVGTTLVPLQCNAFVSTALSADPNIIDPAAAVNGLASSMFVSGDLLSASCELYGQYDEYLVDSSDPDADSSLVYPMLLQASAICLKQ